MQMHGLNVPLTPSGAETIPEEKKGGVDILPKGGYDG